MALLLGSTMAELLAAQRFSGVAAGFGICLGERQEADGAWSPPHGLHL